MSPDEHEYARRIQKQEQALQAQKNELRVRKLQLRSMSFKRGLCYFLAPFGVKLEVAKLSIYLVIFGGPILYVYVDWPKPKQDAFVEIIEKWSYPCRQSFGLLPFDQFAIDRLKPFLKKLAQDSHRPNGIDWGVRVKDRNEVDYSPDRIAALSMFIRELEWLSPEGRRIAMLQISELGQQVNRENKKR